MSTAATPRLAAAVSNAGALGMISGTWQEPDALRTLIREVKAQTALPFGVNLGLEWPQEKRLAVCLEEGVSVISLFWGDPSPYVQQAHDGGAVVIHTIGSSEQARSMSWWLRAGRPEDMLTAWWATWLWYLRW